jgi:hypothetical protein
MCMLHANSAREDTCSIGRAKPCASWALAGQGVGGVSVASHSAKCRQADSSLNVGAVTTTTGPFVATWDGRTVTIEHRAGDDIVLIDVLLTGAIRDERADVLDTYLRDA